MLCFFSEGGGLPGWAYILIGFGIALVVIGSLWLDRKLKKKRDPRDRLKEQEPEFKKPLLNSDNEMFISIPRNITYTVGKEKENMIKPGEYILRSSSGKENFNVRYNGLVQEFASESKVTLGQGDSICCVSDSLVVVADLPKEEQ